MEILYFMKKPAFFAVLLLISAVSADIVTDTRNLLVNPEFNFTAFIPHRDGKRSRQYANYVPYWNADTEKSVYVLRDCDIKKNILPPFSSPCGVRLAPGRSFHQFFTLPEGELLPGDAVSLSFWGYQETPGALKGEIRAMKIESADGTWSPAKDFKLRDKRTFRKMSRGELVVARNASGVSPVTGKPVEIKIENMVIPGNFTPGKESYSKDNNTVGIEVRFTNTSAKDVWVFYPSLVRGVKAFRAVGKFRTIPEYYRHIPRTMQKLWKGEPIHIVFMGSSIDRGSANPPLYPYNEDPESPKYKQPLSDSHTGFSTRLVGRPDLDPYFAWSNHYFSAAGRLKVELMKKFNVSGDKILMNFMAADGSCVGEAHSGLKAYCELLLPPAPHLNGHKEGNSWQKLYPGLFSRPEGPRPDLVIYGSGANEKTDTPDECAVFEGAIRYIQRNYPGTEFIGCMYNSKSSTPNFADMQAIALRYGIPFIDFGIINSRITRSINPNAIGNNDGHPQASVHYMMFKQLERAFECAGPVVSGFPQQHLPERIMNTTVNWEGRMKLYKPDSRRFFRPGAFVVDDGAFNCWAVLKKKLPKGKKAPAGNVYINGVSVGTARRSAGYDLRNSFFRYGRYSAMDRQVVELADEFKFSAIDCKQLLCCTFTGVETGAFDRLEKAQPYQSLTGYPYGKYIAVLQPGKSCTVKITGTAFSAVWADDKNGGTLTVEVDGKKIFDTETNVPYTLKTKEKLFMENRKGITGLAYGVHTVTFKAGKSPVKLMGIYSYDLRSSRSNERIIRNFSNGGEYLFEEPFKAVPVIRCYDGLKLVSSTAEKAVFSGRGSFEAIGE